MDDKHIDGEYFTVNVSRQWLLAKLYVRRALLTSRADIEFPPCFATTFFDTIRILLICVPFVGLYLDMILPLRNGHVRLQPQAVNAKFDVFSGNRRDVLTLNWSPKGEAGPTIPVAFVAVGAMLVGSIAWTNASQGATVQRGDESGYFAYGGSHHILVFPPEAKVQWDQDLLENSKNRLETMVRVGDRIGVSNA